MIDISALNGNKQAMNDLMVYLENEKLKLERKKEKRRLKREAERERKEKEEKMANQAVCCLQNRVMHFSSASQNESPLSDDAASQKSCITRYVFNKYRKFTGLNITKSIYNAFIRTKESTITSDEGMICRNIY
jgi:hypothetical protein